MGKVDVGRELFLRMRLAEFVMNLIEEYNLCRLTIGNGSSN